MKSRKSSLHVTTIKPKIVTAKSQNAITNTNIKSLTDVVLKKNLSALQQYNNLFGNKSASIHIGDADTHFRKSLRKYNEFNYFKNTGWIKPKTPIKAIKNHIHKHIEQQKASGDKLDSDQEDEDEKSELDLSITESQSRSRSESRTNSHSQLQSTSQYSMAEEGQNLGEVLTAPEQTPDAAQETIPDVAPEATPDIAPDVEPEADPEVVPEATLDVSEVAPENDEDFKTLLDKSLEELKSAVEQLDSEALDEITTNVHDTLGELEGVGDVKPEDSQTNQLVPQATGDMRATPTVCDSKVLCELEEAEMQARSTANIINELKDRVAALLAKDHMTDVEAKELEEMNRLLLKHLEDFEAKTKLIQCLVNFADQHMQQMTALPPAQARQPEDMLPKVIICGTTENNMPKIIICDADKKKRFSKQVKRPSILPPQPDVVQPQFVKRLSESYEMQEKLAADNVDLEGKRYQLQEELLNKDKTCENLQKKVCSLQTEMRILARENTVLNDKLAKVQGKCRPRPDMPCGAGRGVCPADVENRLQHYSQTTSALEKQVELMESEVRRMQDELTQVQRDRMELEHQKRMAAQAPPQPPPPQHVCRPTCHGPCRPGAAAEQQLRELREQYNRLQDDYKAKVTEVAGLRADNEKLKCTCMEMDNSKRMAESKAEELERDVRKFGMEHSKLLGSKEQMVEQEQQLAVAKQRFREAQDELEELRALIGDQAAQLDDYRKKYLQAQQQVEEQRRQIDMMEMENSRVGEQVTVEIQRVKNQFQEKLAELSPLPDILKTTQLKVQEEQQMRMLAERNSEALSRELQAAKEKEQQLLSQMDKVRSDQMLSEDERVSMQNKLQGWECKCNDVQQNCDKLKTDLARMEEMASQNEKRLDEKLHEVAQLTAMLESVREESARQVARTKDRCETVRRSMQGQIADLERQLAQARAIARSAQKDRDEIRQKMQSQINNLNENFEEAQLRIRSLQGHVNYLRTSYTNMFGAAGQPDQANDDGCDCGNFS